jgi:Ice-binding-like
MRVRPASIVLLRTSAACMLLLSLAPGCGSSKVTSSTDGGAGGSPTGTGGVTGTGGAHAAGGATATGGATSAGGTTGTGGTPGAGGKTSTGGTPGSGGKPGTGGTPGSGGKTGTGGTPGSGGKTGAGGATDGGTSLGGSTSVAGMAVNLRTAASYVILAKTAISTVPPAAITGNLGVSPAAATYITGFSLIADATNAFSTSAQVSGKVFAADHATPTPSNLTAAIHDMELAFTDAAGRAPGVTELGAGNIGGMTLPPGVYGWATGLLIPASITLSGGATAVWIFQVAQGLTLGNAVAVSLTGGALPRNVFWQVSGAVTVGTTAHLAGVVLCQTAIAMKSGASLEGRLLAQTAVTLDTNMVTEPAP